MSVPKKYRLTKLERELMEALQKEIADGEIRTEKAVAAVVSEFSRHQPDGRSRRKEQPIEETP